ncbi:dihydrolipoyl dehydrogenase [Peribacillus alkalitolerans]|uniref:dihydrolipoyl dehydrogenase n=1 Tax=Peribacillus alkalitolerans TaxID=1550385 RepID=UPI0013D38B7E|nr:dihydrolipoyl dehydrogenase [Peribacillus alkalitolerans]
MVVGEIAEERDVVIIGGGPGGYHAAIRAAQLGLSVTLIEKEALGGVCLNKGCIPSKVFSVSAKKMDDFKQAGKFGLRVEQVEFDISLLHAEKKERINSLKQGIQSLLKANSVEIINGTASFISDDRIGVENDLAFTVYRFKHAIIATGSRNDHPNFIQVDHKRILDGLSIYSLGELPEKLVIYGDDYIALEVASSFNLLGSEITLIFPEERSDFSFDSSINKELRRQLKKKKIQVIKGTSIGNVDQLDGKLSIQFGDQKIEATHLYLSGKVIPNTEDLGLSRIGVKTTNEGFILTDSTGRTSKPTIYAVGDVTEGPTLAVKAIKQGKVAAESIAGILSESDQTFIPTVIHMKPPMAFVGMTEEQARQHVKDIQVAEFSLGGNGYASLLGEKDGLVKVISDASSNLVLGVHMIGQGAVELISCSVLALEMVARTEDLEFIHYPHPSINESVLEAVEALRGKAVHLPPSKQKEHHFST